MAGTLVISTLSDGTNSTSSTNCIQGSAKAWVNFDPSSGTSATVKASYNVSSVTYNATGAWTVNFTNAFTDANYVVAATAKMAGSGGSIMVIDQTTAPTTSACKLNNYNTISGNLNVSIVTAAFFR